MSGSIRASTSRGGADDAAVAPEPAPLAELPRQPRAFWSLWIFVDPVRPVAVRRVLANDKPIAGAAIGASSSSPIFRFYPETDFRRRLPDRGRLPRPRGALPDRRRRARGLLRRSRRRSSPRRARPAPSTARRSQRAGCSGRRSPTASTPSTTSAAPRPRRPIAQHWLGTDDTARDVLARVIYGFRLSVLFALIVTAPDQRHRHRRGRGAGLFRRLDRPDLPADHRDLGRDAEPLHHHHPRRDLGR